MAPKRGAKSQAPPPPPAASSSSETDSRSRSEESEDEETALASPPPPTRNPPAPPQKGEESETTDDEDEEEEEEEDDEEEEPARAAPVTAPPVPQQQGEESDEEGESSESDEEAPPPEQAAKMEAEKLKPPPSSGEAKKPGGIPRIWSTDDEVRILEALVAHRQEHGVLPHPDALMEALAGKLDNRAYGSKELQSKQATLRQRYNNAIKRGEVPTKEHDRQLYDLSNIIWGSGKTAAAKANGDEPRSFAEMCELYPYLAEEVKELEAGHPGLFKREFGKMDDDKARAMDTKIKRQRLVQMKVEMRRGDLAKEVRKTLIELLD